MFIVVVTIIVCCGLIFSQHEGEKHESSLLLSLSDPAYIQLHGRLRLMLLKMKVAASEAMQMNDTGIIIFDPWQHNDSNNTDNSSSSASSSSGSASSSGSYYYPYDDTQQQQQQQEMQEVKVHRFSSRDADHIGEDDLDQNSGIVQVYNVSLVILGKVAGENKLWEVVKPPTYLELSASHEDPQIDTTLQLTRDEIAKYEHNFILKVSIIDDNTTDSSSSSSDGGYYYDDSSLPSSSSSSSSPSSSSSSSSSSSPSGLVIEVISKPFVLDFEIIYMPKAGENSVLIAFIILLGVYAMIVFELFHRTLAALIGSFWTVSFLSYLQNRPTFHEIVDWVDFDTVGVLFGMMVMVGILSTTGVFEWCAVRAYKISKGDIWKLTVLLCTFTGVVSAFLDNVTTILLIAPVTLRLCDVLNISPINMLLLEVMFSNIGGTATPIGDPPNIIIVSHRKVQAAGVADFLSFTVHVAPGIILSMIGCLWFSKKYQFSNEQEINASVDSAKRLREITIWKKTAAKLHGTEEEEMNVHNQLNEYIATLEAAHEAALHKKNDSVSHDSFVAELEEKYSIHNPRLFKVSAVVMSLVILMFFLHSVTHVPMVWVAIIGSIIHLVAAEVEDIDKALEKVEFSTLLFFAALFIIMRGMEELGLIEFIGETTAHLIRTVPPGNGRLVVAILIILWVSSFVSAFIDNIPYTTTMIPVVIKLSTDNLGLPLGPLLWALVYGACLGGNGTIIGASANVVAAGLAEAHGVHISYIRFLKTGAPTMIVSSVLCTIYLLITHVWWGWY